MTRGAILTRAAGTASLRSAAELGLSGTVDGSAVDAMPFVAGRFSAFNEWTEIADAQGRFMERIAPGAFSRTIREDRQHIRVLFQHGQDPFIGSRPIAPLDGIGEDGAGAWYFGRLFDTIAARELRPLLEAGVLGSSFRFRVDGERVDDRPTRSARNPDALPERTVTAVTLLEIGPCVFPAYRGATAGAATGAHPPRSATPHISQAEFIRRLTTSPAETSAARLARRRWVDKVFPMEAGRR